jgi:hypothetical protein
LYVAEFIGAAIAKGKKNLNIVEFQRLSTADSYTPTQPDLRHNGVANEQLGSVAKRSWD